MTAKTDHQPNNATWMTSGPIPTLPVPSSILVGCGPLIQGTGRGLANGPALLLRYRELDRDVVDEIQRLRVDTIHWAAQGNAQYLWFKLDSGDFFGLELPEHAVIPEGQFWYLQLVAQAELYWAVRTFQVSPDGEVLHDSGVQHIGALEGFYGTPAATVN